MTTSRPAWTLEDDRVIQTEFYFDWVSGMSLVCSQRSVSNLHDAIYKYGNSTTLEISRASTINLGSRLSAFNLRLNNSTLECVFQSSKVYRYGGPYLDLLNVQPATAKKDERHKTSGRLIGFRYEDRFWFPEPKTAFYDYIYVRSALSCIHKDDLNKLKDYDYFTDIMFNPMKSINCQARAVAILKYIILNKRIDVIQDKITWLNFHKWILRQE